MKFFRPESEMRAVLERSAVVILTGITIIGPTASMIPDAFFRRGVSVMAGVRISDPEKMSRILKQGGSAYHLLAECCERIAFVNAVSDS